MLDEVGRVRLEHLVRELAVCAEEAHRAERPPHGRLLERDRARDLVCSRRADIVDARRPTPARRRAPSARARRRTACRRRHCCWFAELERRHAVAEVRQGRVCGSGAGVCIRCCTRVMRSSLERSEGVHLLALAREEGRHRPQRGRLWAVQGPRVVGSAASRVGDGDPQSPPEAPALRGGRRGVTHVSNGRSKTGRVDSNDSAGHRVRSARPSPAADVGLRVVILLAKRTRPTDDAVRVVVTACPPGGSATSAHHK